MLDLIVFLSLLTLGYLFGRHAEHRHYRSIHERERALINLVTTNGRRPLNLDGHLDKVSTEARLVTGNAVISVDYFKRFLAGLRNLFGGNLRSYETLVDRARREAILRLKESCADADQIINLRLETSSISKGRRQQIGAVEVLAYATAIYCR